MVIISNPPYYLQVVTLQQYTVSRQQVAVLDLAYIAHDDLTYRHLIDLAAAYNSKLVLAFYP